MENRIRKLLALTLLSLSLLAFAATHAIAGGGPENVFLVVNGSSRSSKVIANHYIALRNIPASHVIYLTGVPKREIITVTEFQKTILEPVLNEMVARRINENIDYIVYSSDFPTRITVSDHQKRLKKRLGNAFQAKIYSPVASITSITYFSGQVLSDDPTYIALNSNYYYRGAFSAGLNRPFQGDVQDEYRKAVLALDKTGAEFDAAKEKLFDLSKKYPGQAAVYFQLARFLAKNGETSLAMTSLKHAAAMGWRDVAQVKREKKFDGLRDDPKFVALVKRMGEIDSPFIPPHGFRSVYTWGPNGMINKSGQGRRYMLSAMLSVTRDFGMSDRDSINYLTRAAAADDTHPEGTIYFTHTKDVRTTTRLRNYGPAINVLKQMGQISRIEKTVLPSKRDDILGLTCGTSKFDFGASGCKFIPGAFADNLTSSGGVFISGQQTKLTEFLRFGAAGACGTVVEPFAIQAKFPHPMFHAHYLAGCSLAEAFYQSVNGPYQIILVGDPLCQPFVNRPKIKITSPAPMSEVAGKVKIELSREGSDVKAAGVEIFLDGAMIHRSSNINHINLDTSDLKDGFHELRIVSVSRDGIESRGSAILPMIINNKKRYTNLTIKKTTCKFPESVKVSAETNFGERIIIRQNFKTVGVITSAKGSTEVSTGNLGVGEIKLQAVSYRDGENAGVASAPITVTVEGAISSIPDKK